MIGRSASATPPGGARAVRWAKGLARAAMIGLLAFIIFGPLANLLLWAFAERWYFPG